MRELQYTYSNRRNSVLITRLKELTLACERESEVQARKVVKADDLLRRQSAAVRLSKVDPLSIPPLLPSSKWLGGAVLNAYPINTATRQLNVQSCRDGLHVMEFFGGIGLGVLRSALAANYSVRCYTYVDKDPISRRIARSTLKAL